MQLSFPEGVASLLIRMNDAQAIEQLTKTYGGTITGPEIPEGDDSHGDDEGVLFAADDDELFAGTTPFLLAARSGTSAMLSAALRAMQDKLSPLKVTIELYQCSRSRIVWTTLCFEGPGGEYLVQKARTLRDGPGMERTRSGLIS